MASSSQSPLSDDKPLALRKTPRLAAGSNMYRGSPNQQMLSSKNKDAVSSSCKRVSRSASFSESSSKKSTDTAFRIMRRKRSSDASGSPVYSKRKRTSKDNENRNDGFCWTCHKEGVLISCEVCPRAFHARCASTDKGHDDEWVCPECDLVLKAENVDLRSNAMQALSVDQLCNLLKFAVSRMKHQCPDEFMKPVPLDQFPSYSNFIVHPMDLETLEKNIKKKMYGCTESFLADAKWILHNCIIFNGYNHKLTSAAKALLKICKHEMSEIEVCPDCYHNAYTKRENWFQEPCCPPHLLIWAKLKGFPFWPAKAMRVVSGNVDVRFFGAHDRAWIPVAQCFLLSNDIPTTMKIKKKGVFEQSMEELAQHIKNVKDRFQVFRYAPFRAAITGEDLSVHIQSMLPGVNLKDFTRSFVGKNSQPLKCQQASNQSGTESDSYASRSGANQDPEAGEQSIKQEIASHPTFSVKLLKYPVCEIPKLEHSRVFKPRAESMKKLESAIEKIKSFGRDLEACGEGAPASPEGNQNVQDESGSSNCPDGAPLVTHQLNSESDLAVEGNAPLLSTSSVDACEVSSTTSSLILKTWSLARDRNDSDVIVTTRPTSAEDVEEELEGTNGKQSPDIETVKYVEALDKPFAAQASSPMHDEHASSEEDSSGAGGGGGTLSEAEFPHGEVPISREDIGPQPFECQDGSSTKMEALVETGEVNIQEPDCPHHAVVPQPTETHLEAEFGLLKSASGDAVDDTKIGDGKESSLDSLELGHRIEPEGLAVDEFQGKEIGRDPDAACTNVCQTDAKTSERSNDVDVSYASKCPHSEESGDGTEPSPSTSKSVSGPADTPTTESSDTSSPSDSHLQKSCATVNEIDVNEDQGLTILSVTSLSKDSDILDSCKSDEACAPSESTEAVGTPEPTTVGEGCAEEGELVIDLDRDREEGQTNANKSKKMLSRSPFGGIKLREKKGNKEKEKERKSCPGSRVKGKTSALDASSSSSHGGSIASTSGNTTVRSLLPMLSPLGLRNPRNIGMQQPSARSMPTLQPRPSISLTVPPTSSGPCSRSSEDTGLNKYSQKMVDFVRGTMEEMVKDLAKTGNPEATIKTLQLELEKLQWKHQQEMIEMKHNTDLILLEMRNSMESEKQRAIADVRRQCEMEKQKAIEETKKKQWCAFCGKEAIFYCCWNTSYCDYPCQQAHWPQHVNVCSQALQSNDLSGGEARMRDEISNEGGRSISRRHGGRGQKQSEVPSDHQPVVLAPSQLQGGGPMAPAVASVQVIPPNTLHNSPFQLQYIGNQSQAAVLPNITMQAPITATPFGAAAVSNAAGFSLPQGMAGPGPGTVFQQRPLQGSNLIFPIMSTQHPNRPTMATSHLPQSTQILVSHGMRPAPPSVSFLRGPSHPQRGRSYLL